MICHERLLTKTEQIFFRKITTVIHNKDTTYYEVVSKKEVSFYAEVNIRYITVTVCGYNGTGSTCDYRMFHFQLQFYKLYL